MHYIQVKWELSLADLDYTNVGEFTFPIELLKPLILEDIADEENFIHYVFQEELEITIRDKRSWFPLDLTIDSRTILVERTDLYTAAKFTNVSFCSIARDIVTALEDSASTLSFNFSTPVLATNELVRTFRAFDEDMPRSAEKIEKINKRLQRFAKTTDSIKVSTNEESRPKTIEPLNSDFWN